MLNPSPVQRTFFVKFIFFFYFCDFVLFSSFLVSKNFYHEQAGITETTWELVEPFLLPESHPIKEKLDRIFKRRRAISTVSSLKKAGFTHIIRGKWTRLMVAHHPKLPDYIFKFYLDRQRYHQRLPEYYFWIKRCEGAELIRKEIEEYQWGDIFKVPHKWIYPLPPYPLPNPEIIKKTPAKYFILVEENMKILSKTKSERMWKSSKVTTDLLDKLFFILQKHGLYDCAKPDNIPFCKDKRIAFVDTQTHNPGQIPAFEKLLNVLSSNMKRYWQAKIDEVRKKDGS